jgi:F-type H+-transporting ATPase subunit gamma
MKSYITYKNQIQGIKNVSETVKTVEKIAASSVHFLKNEVSSLNIYASKLEEVLTRLSLFYQKKNHPLLQRIGDGGKTLVILTSGKGLVGGLWHGVINVFLENAKQYQSIIVIGAKGRNYLKEEDMQIIKSFTNFFDIPQKEEVENVTDYIFDEFKKGTFSQIDILYPRFVSLAEQTPTLVPFIPFNFKLKKEESGDGLPIFEPSGQRIFDRLLQKYIEVFFHKIMMETKLSELSARTVAMEHAATKTEEIVQKLTLDYTKQRRRIITQRQLESFTAHKII